MIYVINGEMNIIVVIDVFSVSMVIMVDLINIIMLMFIIIVLFVDINGVILGSLISIVVSGDFMVVVVFVDVKIDNGYVLFYNGLDSFVLVFLDFVEVGVLLDMVIFMLDGGKVLVVNEGEFFDDYIIDFEGFVSVINIFVSGELEEMGMIVGFIVLNGIEVDLMV